MSGGAPQAVSRARELVEPALRREVARIEDDHMRLIASYQLGWCDAAGKAVTGGGGKAIRPTLALLSAEAGGDQTAGIAPAVAVELVHNFSLLHDDIMDRDVERRHRPTGWVVFGEGQTILGGTAMLTAAMQALIRAGDAGLRSLPCLLSATQELISGQSLDLRLEGEQSVNVEDVLHMEAGKTAALLACSASIGAIAAGASAEVVDALRAYGHDLGMAFQLVDDILGVTGDPDVTGKSSSSDVRAGKRSAPIVAALAAGGAASERLGTLLVDGPPTSEQDVELATKLIDEAGGLDWAAREAESRMTRAISVVRSVPIDPAVTEELVAVGRYIVERDR